MKGYIRKRSKDSWSITIELPRDFQTDKRQQKFYTVKGTKRDAERFLRETLNNLDKFRSDQGQCS